ncbi:MAG: hypothetical protein LAT56_00325 [Wenzhouxiangella sp.]|nr:hypothetical protein [Wenzhouxiangella sp.]
MPDASKHMLTMAESAKRMNNGMLVEIAELMEETNDILDDLQFAEASNITTHRSTQRTSLARGDWRQYNQGVGNAVTSTRQIDEEVASLEIYSEVDVDLAKQTGNPKAFRKSEDVGITEGLGQQLAETIIYGNRADNPAAITGLAPRLNEHSNPSVFNAGGTTGNLTSIYLVQHGLRRYHAFYPRGSQLGMNIRDLGEVTVQDEDGGKFQAYRTHFAWKFGHMIRDPKCVVRIANVPVVDDFDNMSKFERIIIQALNYMPMRGQGAVIYANKDLMTQFDIKAMDKSNVQYRSSEVFGKEITMFRTNPIRLVEAILSTEDVVPENA